MKGTRAFAWWYHPTAPKKSPNSQPKKKLSPDIYFEYYTEFNDSFWFDSFTLSFVLFPQMKRFHTDLNVLCGAIRISQVERHHFYLTPMGYVSSRILRHPEEA